MQTKHHGTLHWGRSREGGALKPVPKPVLVTFRMEQRTLSTARSQHNGFPRSFHSHFGVLNLGNKLLFLPVQEVRKR